MDALCSCRAGTWIPAVATHALEAAGAAVQFVAVAVIALLAGSRLNNPISAECAETGAAVATGRMPWRCCIRKVLAVARFAWLYAGVPTRGWRTRVARRIGDASFAHERGD